MKKTFLFVIVLFYVVRVSAQLNMEYKSHVEYNETLNDIWGYAAPDNREYALVGLQEGVSIVDVTDTENPVIKGYAPGPSSTWRDIKTWGEYAYVTNETGGGLLVIDLSNLPNNLTDNDYFYWEPEIPSLEGILSSAHNIFIDEYGYAILSGTNLNGGGLIFIDVTNPGIPQFAGAGSSVYSHDIYARDNKAYSSEIYDGQFAVYDITNKANVSLIATQQTQANFTHNSWLNDAGDVIFTTDEKANAPIGSYDISDLGNIEELDQFRPLITLGDGVIPHNVHVWNDWLIISYYSDGCIIVDGSRPDNLIEVGNFDTYIPTSTGFNGAWGAYPFLPSETVLVSDRGNGCYILEPTYVRACWLEGKVTDSETGNIISGVKVDIDSPQLNSGETDPLGNYKSGQAIAGTFDVTFTGPPDYYPLTTQAVLENGIVTVLDVQLTKLPSQAVSGSVVVEADGSPVPFASVFIVGNITEYETAADASGNFSIQSVIEDDYTLYAGAWGYVNDSITTTISGSPSTLTIELKKGYVDDFIVDLGWAVTTTAQTGAWERDRPNGTFYNNDPANPGFDIQGDVGDKCYVTGNSGTTPTNDDIDNGYTIITSPLMNLSGFNVPIVRYNTWFFNGGNGVPNDALEVRVHNGNTEEVLETITISNSEWNSAVEFSLSDYIDITENMTISFYTSDQVNDNEGHIVEAGVDGFSVYDANPTALAPVFDETLIFDVFPNPFQNSFSVNYQLDNFDDNAVLKIFNVLGQLVEMIEIQTESGIMEIGSLQNKGIYFLQFEVERRVSKSLKVVKH